MGYLGYPFAHPCPTRRYAMSLRPEPLLPIPDVTAAAVRAAFPKGNLYVDLRTEFGTLYEDQLFADLYPAEGRPVEVPPLALGAGHGDAVYRKAHGPPGCRCGAALHGLEICAQPRPARSGL